MDPGIFLPGLLPPPPPTESIRAILGLPPPPQMDVGPYAYADQSLYLHMVEHKKRLLIMYAIEVLSPFRISLSYKQALWKAPVGGASGTFTHAGMLYYEMSAASVFVKQLVTQVATSASRILFFLRGWHANFLCLFFSTRQRLNINVLGLLHHGNQECMYFFSILVLQSAAKII